MIPVTSYPGSVSRSTIGNNRVEAARTPDAHQGLAYPKDLTKEILGPCSPDTYPGAEQAWNRAGSDQIICGVRRFSGIAAARTAVYAYGFDERTAPSSHRLALAASTECNSRRSTMRVFVTGATGFIGSHVVAQLIETGHQVVGLSRSDRGAETLARAGAEVFRGDLGDLDGLHSVAQTADGVIHAAFNHDFSRLKEHSEEDRRVIDAIGAALVGSDKPFLVSSGTGLVDRTKIDGPATEGDVPVGSADFPRAATEEAADAVAAKGVRVVVVRLSQVHDTSHQGRLAQHVRLAREKGYVAYVGEGENRLSAVHVSDAARLYRLALEQGTAGARYHAVAEEGVAMRGIADVLGQKLKLPVRSITPAETEDYFGWIAGLATIDLAASSALTRQKLGWNPTGPGLLTDLRAMDSGVD